MCADSDAQDGLTIFSLLNQMGNTNKSKRGTNRCKIIEELIMVKCTSIGFSTFIIRYYIFSFKFHLFYCVRYNGMRINLKIYYEDTLQISNKN